METLVWTTPSLLDELVQEVVQTDRTQKRVFVLGVYASAVHAHWIREDGRTIVKALAVASEPYIFWRGEGVESILHQISVPPEVGRLIPTSPQFTGPSGNALDKLILEPLGLKREDSWLCDLVPHSCMNPGQHQAIEREYKPLMKDHKLPTPTVPPVPNKLMGETRRGAIVDEIREADSSIIILLGDKPIRWFLKFYDDRWNKLADFDSYGQLHHTLIDGREVTILPLAHPRQIDKLGHSSPVWYDRHRIWIGDSAPKLLADMG